MKTGDRVLNINGNSMFFEKTGTVISVNPNMQYGVTIIWDDAKRTYTYRNCDLEIIKESKTDTIMKIGDKVRIPFGSRAGEPAFVRDIKGTNIWLCLESNPGAQAVLFHLGDFDAQTILDHMNGNDVLLGNANASKPEKKWIIWSQDAPYTNDVWFLYSSALAELERIAKQHPGKKFGLMELVAEAEVTSVVKITKV